MQHCPALTRSLVIFLAQVAVSLGEVTFLPPTPYLSVADSPFDLSGIGTTFFLEDFEDGVFDLPPGVTPYAGIINPPGPFTDSVDADDGALDGSGTAGHTLTPILMTITPTGPPTWITHFGLIYDATTLGFVPTSFGFVWTDGLPSSRIAILVIEENNVQTYIQFPALMDANYTGETLEDRFIGLTSDVGLRRVFIANGYTGDNFQQTFEMDHFQFGIQVPEPIWGGMGCLMLSMCWCRLVHRSAQMFGVPVPVGTS
jgi:hypothetical protein